MAPATVKSDEHATQIRALRSTQLAQIDGLIDSLRGIPPFPRSRKNNVHIIWYPPPERIPLLLTQRVMWPHPPEDVGEK